MSTRLKLDYASSVFPTELYCHILSDVATLFPEDQYELTRDKGFSYTRAEARFKTCFLSYSLVCRRWHELVQPYLHRVTAIRAGQVEKRFAYSTSLQGVLEMLDLKPHLLKHVRHLRLLPPNRHTQIRDPILLPRILDRFTKLRILELVNLEFTPQSIQEHLCDLDSTKQKYITNPLKLDRFAFYATPETILPVNAVIFLLLLVSEAKSFLFETHPKTMWSIYASSGSAQAADVHTLGTSFIPRRGCLRTTSFSLKSCSLPADIVQYLVWAGTFQSNTITNFYLQADHQRLRNFYTHFRPVHSHLLELTLDLSRYVVPHNMADLFPISFTGLRSLQKLWLKVPLVSGLGGRSTIFKVITTLAFRGVKSISSLRFFSLTIVDLEDKRLSMSTVFRLIPACDFAVDLLAPAEKDPTRVTISSLDNLEVMLTGELGQPYKVPLAKQTYITDRLPNLHSSGVLSFV